MTPVTAPTSEVEQLKKQNAMLLRALMRVKAERDALAQQLAAVDAERQQAGR